MLIHRDIQKIVAIAAWEQGRPEELTPCGWYLFGVPNAGTGKITYKEKRYRTP